MTNNWEKVVKALEYLISDDCTDTQFDYVDEISEAIGFGKVLKCEDGFIWLRRGTPWCQNLRDEADPIIKRRYLNITAEYLTLN